MKTEQTMWMWVAVLHHHEFYIHVFLLPRPARYVPGPQAHLKDSLTLSSLPVLHFHPLPQGCCSGASLKLHCGLGPNVGAECPGWAMGKGEGEQKRVVSATKVCGAFSALTT